MIPTGKALMTTIKQPKPFSAISSAASNTVLFDSIVITSFVIISFTDGINYQVKRYILAIKALLLSKVTFWSLQKISAARNLLNV